MDLIAERTSVTYYNEYRVKRKMDFISLQQHSGTIAELLQSFSPTNPGQKSQTPVVGIHLPISDLTVALLLGYVCE